MSQREPQTSVEPFRIRKKCQGSHGQNCEQHVLYASHILVLFLFFPALTSIVLEPVEQGPSRGDIVPVRGDLTPQIRYQTTARPILSLTDAYELQLPHELPGKVKTGGFDHAAAFHAEFQNIARLHNLYN